MNPRVVVTGAGMAVPIGTGIEAVSEALWRGDSGVASSQRFPGYFTSEFHDFDPSPWLGHKGVRVLDRGTRFLCVAAQMALSATGLLQDATGQGDDGLGLVCGTMFSGTHSIAEFDWSGLIEGPGLVSPMGFSNTVINASAGQAAIKHKLRGVNSTISAGLASGLCAIDYAAGFLRLGRARYLLAGGAEEVCAETVLGFRKLHRDSPTGRARPFDIFRNGAFLGEGAALWMLEREDTALSRGQTPLFEIGGFGSAHQGFDLTQAAEASAASEAIEKAVDESGIAKDRIACIVSGASGNLRGDEVEACALRRVFGARLESVPVCAPKAALGEAMGAAGAFGALVAGCALARQEAPPTAGFSRSDLGLSLSALPQPFEGEYALITAFSCDGNNAALVIRLWSAARH